MPVKIRIYLNTFSTANTANYWLIKMEIGTFNLALRILFVFTVTFYFDLWIPNNKYCTVYRYLQSGPSDPVCIYGYLLF